MGRGGLAWLDLEAGPDVLALVNGAVTIIANTGSESVRMPMTLDVLATSAALEQYDGGTWLPGDTTIWALRRTDQRTEPFGPD